MNAIDRISVEPSRRCSKGCSFCYNGSSSEGASAWTPDDIVAFARDCAAGGVKAISFGGGEPLEWAPIFDVLASLEGHLGRTLTTRQAALAAVVRPYLLRRTKAEVAPELPPRTEVVRFVDLSPAETELYESRASPRHRVHARRGRKGGRPGGALRLLAALTRLRQLACHPRLRNPESSVPSTKLKSVLALIDELEDAGHRALVFSQFTGHLEIVAEALTARGVAFFELTGSTPAEDRADRVRRFQAGNADVFLISLKAGGTGLNLTAADYVVHLDPWWNPAAEDQASDRAHRIGQDKPVTVVRMIARGTIEENLLALHSEKRELAESVLSGGDIAARLSTSELFALMEKSAGEESVLEAHDFVALAVGGFGTTRARQRWRAPKTPCSRRSG